jgi:hypothetical protein
MKLAEKQGSLFTSITECCAYFGTVLISAEALEGVNPQVGNHRTSRESLIGFH